MSAALKNRYILLRHGQSIANVQDLIVSNPENGIPDYGLSEKGKREAEQAATLIAALVQDVNTNTQAPSHYPHNVSFVTSDFLRTKETTDIVTSKMSYADVSVDIRLRERQFGDFELQSSENYARVWEQDAHSPQHTQFNVECIAHVRDRASSLVLELDRKYPSGHVFVLVSHGDTLQILQTWFANIDPTQHRQLDHLETCKPRLMDARKTI
eukprot:m.411160 g.411160  ORF g.411160 m.411160 type:complete len:212 (-) comp21247_c0_seq13:398-1033(-)